MPLRFFLENVKVVSIKHKGPKMAEQIEKIENELHKFENGFENGLITEKEFIELRSTLAFELELLTSKI
jgi:hypothetical protein